MGIIKKESYLIDSYVYDVKRIYRPTYLHHYVHVYMCVYILITSNVKKVVESNLILQAIRSH